MNNGAYKKALSYSYHLLSNRDNTHNHSYDYRDLVHDAYQIWFDKTSNCLFDQHPYVISKTIKNLWYDKYVKTRRMKWRGHFYPKVYNRVDEYTPLDFNDFKDFGRQIFVLRENATPESILLSKEKFKTLNNRLNVFDRSVLDRMIEGYKLGEIQGLINRSNPIITASVKRIREEIKKLY